MLSTLFKRFIVLFLIFNIFITSCSNTEIDQPYVDYKTAKTYYTIAACKFSFNHMLLLDELLDGNTDSTKIVGAIKQEDLLSFDKYYYCDVNILKKENMTLRLYFGKEEPNRVYEAVFLYDSLCNTDILFNIGDNALKIKEKYQEIYHCHDPFEPESGMYFFDILNNAGLYRYHCENNIIVDREMIMKSHQ